MREILISEECDIFVNKNKRKIYKKYLYLLQIMIDKQVIHSSFVKKLINSNFYELRILLDNEYRILLFSCDNENFNECKKAILLNGFIKKSKKDYKKAIEIANKLLIKYKEDCYE